MYKYSQNYIQKEVIDYLEKDGALCDYYSKYYKEKETYNGGVGDRLAFKNYNDKITKYQNILKVLTGERRANIYEAIPAIDFDDPKFTGFDYTYNVENDTSTGQTTLTNDEIVPIPSSEGKTSMDLLEEEDKYTINRALMGETVAEHFYNTTGLSSSSYDLQVSPYVFKDNNYKYVYSGVLASNTFKDGIYTDDIRITDLLYYPVTQATSMYFNEDTPRIVGVIETKSDGKKYLVDVLQSDSDLSSEVKSTGNIVLNVDCGWDKVYNSKYEPIDTGSYTHDIQHTGSVEFNGKNIVVAVGTENTVEYQYFGHYMLNLDAGDILVAIPSNSYTLNCTKLIIFKKNNTSSASDYIASYETAYFNSYNKRFYENATFTRAINPQSDKYKDKYILPKNAENENNVYSYSSLTTGFELVDSIKSINTATKQITLQKSLKPYTCYILYIKGFNKDINSFDASIGYDPSAVFSRVAVGEEMPDDLMSDSFIIDALQDYISVTCNFLSNASGLLTGLFSEPYSYTSSSDAETVSEWTLKNDRQSALSGGMDIDVGTEYFSGHILNRGDILASPLKLTPSDTYNGKSYTQLKDEGINGKATLFFKKLTSMGNVYDSILNSYKVSDNNVFFTSQSSIKRVLTQESFIDSSKLLYSKRLRNSGNTAISLGDIQNYINNWVNMFENDGKTLVINLNSSNVRSEWGKRTFNNRFFVSNETTYSGKTLDDFYKTREEVKTQSIDVGSPALMAFYYRHGYTKHWRSDVTQGLTNPFEAMYFSFYTPMDLFVDSSGSDYDNVLIFPSEKRYFPQKVILMSHKDLGLTQEKTCFFSGKDRFIGFKVNTVTKILPSKITKIKVIDTYYNTSTFFDLDVIPLLENTDSEGFGKMSYMNDRIQNSLNFWDNYIHKGYKDCYIYYLTPIDTQSLQKGVNLYDANDELIDSFSDNFNYSELYPLSYAVNADDRLFKGAKTDSSTYQINPNNREDFSKLIGFNIMAGVPSYTVSKMSGTVKWKCNIKSCSGMYSNTVSAYNAKNFLYTFANMVEKDDNTGIVKEMIRDLISNWKMSSSTSNPIYLKDLPQVFKGLIDLRTELLDLSDNGVSIDSSNGQITINKSDYKNIINLINGSTEDSENRKRIRKFKLDITVPEGIETSDVNSSNSFETECNRLITSQLNKLEISLKNPDGTSWDNTASAEYCERASIEDLNTLFNSALFNNLSSQSLAELEGTCQLVDKYFGNDTMAFLSIGEATTTNGERIDDSSSLSGVRSDIIDCASEVVYNVVTNVKSISDNEAFEKAKAVYKKYYTDESVEEGVTLQKRKLLFFRIGKPEVTVDWRKLIPRKEQKSLILKAYNKGNSTFSVFRDYWDFVNF